MNSAQIATFVNVFNTAAVCAAALFAVCGILALAGRKSKPAAKGLRGNAFFRAFCVAAIAAFALEFTVFNFQSYLSFFADAPLHTTEPSPVNPKKLLTTDGTEADIFSVDNGNVRYLGVTFQNLDRRVTSIFADVAFNGNETAEMRIMWTDEEGARGYSKTIYKYMPHENYAPLQPCGKVSQITVMFRGLDGSSTVDIINLALNKPIPFYLSGLRLLAVSMLFFMLIVAIRKEPRAKMAYLLFEYRFSHVSKKQNVVYAGTAVLLTLFSFLCVYTTPIEKSTFLSGLIPEQYNKYLVDAILDGRTWLDYGTPERLLGAEMPYHSSWRSRNGFEEGKDWVLDWSWYNGKFYCYFGVVPALILYVPYKAITGDYLSHQAGVSVFVSVLVFLMALFWRRCVIQFMPNARFAFVMLSFLTLFAASGLFCLVRHPTVYTTVQAAGLMFAMAGLLLLLKSVETGEKVSRPVLFFACLCLAIVVGCRPNLIFVSLLVPVLLWKYKSWKLLAFVAIPYIIVAIPLCYYNYIRFGSITDFGVSYNMTIFNITAQNLINPIGKVIRLIVSPIYYLFVPLKYSLSFPFVEHLPPPRADRVIHGVFLHRETGVGIINFPIVFCLFYMIKKRATQIHTAQTFNMLWTFLIIAATLILTNSAVGGFIGRYMADFAPFIIIPTLFCAYYWGSDDNKSIHAPRTRMKVIYTLLAVSVFIGMMSFVTGLGLHMLGAHSPHDPVLYRYLESSFGLIRNI